MRQLVTSLWQIGAGLFVGLFYRPEDPEAARQRRWQEIADRYGGWVD